jgi:hypothetical protein
MSDVKVRVFRGDDQHLATTVTIPGTILRIAANHMPRLAKEAMHAEGIDFDEVVRLSENPEARGNILEVVDHDKNEKVVIALE